MKKNILVFGSIAGVIVATFMAISMAFFSADSNHGSGAMAIGFASMAVAFSFVFVGIKNFRDKQNAGVVTFGQAFVLGLMISLLASTIYVLTWAVEYHFFLPDFMEKYSDMQIRQLKESGLTGAELEASISSIQSMAEQYHNPFLFTVYTYLEILPVGILITLISAFILKRKTPVAG